MFQKLKTFLGYGAGNGLGCQIENTVIKTFSHSFDAWKKGCDGFSYSRGRLDKKFILFFNGTVYHGGQCFLPLPVGKRKDKFVNGCIAPALPVILVNGPFFIPLYQIGEPGCDLIPVKMILKTPDLLCLQIAVGHLHPDGWKISIFCHHIGVAHGLGFVDKERFFQFCYIQKHPLDLVDHDFSVFFKHAIGPPLDLQIKGSAIFLAG